jgi:glycosyltransferase involved in cell wall biosynthesis
MGKTGGIGVFVKQFVKQLKHNDFDITVFSFGTHTVRFNDERITVIKIKDLSGFNEWIKAPLRRYKIPGYITIKKLLEFFNRVYISMYLSCYVYKHQFDLIEFHDYGGDFPYFIGKLPKVVRCHGTAVTLHQFMGYYKRQPDAFFEYQFFKRFNKHVVAVSNTSAEMTQKAFDLKTLPTVIYNGVAIPYIALPEDYLNAATQPYSIFYFGSIRERKGIVIACHVFNAIIEDFPDASFHVMGNNNNDYWNTHAKPILTEKAIVCTTYYGAISNEKINDYLNKAHVVLFPSFGENFSVALLEVMALGKLLVTSDIPAFNEIIVHGENGFISKNLNDYIDQVNAIFLKKIDISFIQMNAFETVNSEFNSETIINKNIIYYKSLLKND